MKNKNLSPEYQLLLLEYKKNLLKYQSGPKWYFGTFESGIDWEGKEITVERMKHYVKKVSPIGPSVPEDLIEDITPTWETYKQFKNYDEYQVWIESQTDAFYYSRGKKEFSIYEAYRIASQLGYSKLIMENLS